MKYNSKEKICDPNYYRKYIKDFYDKDTIAYKQAMETFEIFLKWFGKEWFKKQAAIYNPLIVRFTRPNGIEKNIKLIKLIYYCKNNSSKKVFKEIKKRLKKICITDLKSLQDELTFFWLFNENGFRAEKQLENNEKKNLDLKIQYKDNIIDVELTQLNTPDKELKANKAFKEIVGLKHNYESKIFQSLSLAGRQWSENHIKIIKNKVKDTLENTIQSGYSSFYEENKIKFISWKPKYASEVISVHEKYNLEKNKLHIDRDFTSSIEPFRIRQKIETKYSQATKNNWLLIITAQDLLRTKGDIKNILFNVNEYMYKYPEFIGCMLITWWQGFEPIGLNYNSNEISVIESSINNISQQQTILLKNIFAKANFKIEFWDELIKIVKKYGSDISKFNKKVIRDFR